MMEGRVGRVIFSVSIEGGRFVYLFFLVDTVMRGGLGFVSGVF